MKIQDQVCTWEQGLRLHKLGVVKNSSFFQWMEAIISDDDGKVWAVFRPNVGEYDWMAIEPIHPDIEGEEFETARECSAFTVAELGVMLPLGYYAKTRDFDYNDWVPYDSDHDVMVIDGNFSFATEAQAKAKALIQLLENGCISAEEVNKRLSN